MARSQRRQTRSRVRAQQTSLTRTLTDLALSGADDGTGDLIADQLDLLRPTYRRPKNR